MNSAPHDTHARCVAVLGLGEAGSIFAAGLAAGGAGVRGFDQADVGVPPGVTRRPGHVGRGAQRHGDGAECTVRLSTI